VSKRSVDNPARCFRSVTGREDQPRSAFTSARITLGQAMVLPLSMNRPRKCLIINREISFIALFFPHARRRRAVCGCGLPIVVGSSGSGHAARCEPLSNRPFSASYSPTGRVLGFERASASKTRGSTPAESRALDSYAKSNHRRTKPNAAAKKRSQVCRRRAGAAATQ
jgi:hypothetical protein